MPSNEIAPLTFGVEFEFMIKSRKLFDPQPMDPEPEDRRPIEWSEDEEEYSTVAEVQQHLRDLLGANGFPCTDNDDEWPLHSTDPEEQYSPYSKWEVKGDVSVVVAPEDQNEAYDYTDVEITSPIYYAVDGLNTGFNEIRKVLNLIRNNFRVHVPASSGFHVHVGNGESGFTTLHMKDLMSILYVFDKQIQVIHPNRQYNEYDEEHSFDSYYRAPSRCTLGLHLVGHPGEADVTGWGMSIEEEVLTEVEKLADETFSDAPTEFSQVQRFLNKEQKPARNHVRIRQFFASGPESMVGIGATNIPENQPGALAQRLFRNEAIGVDPTNLKRGEHIGTQLYAHLSQHLKRDLDSDIKNLLLTPGTCLNRTKKYPNPTTLLAPVKLSQAKDMEHLDYVSGTGRRNAAYNINELAAGQNYNLDVKRTIEFRQHQGTLDADRVIAWIQMVTGIVEWVRFAPPVEIARLLRIGGEVVVEEFDLVDLLRYMGLDGPAEYYERVFFLKIA